MNDVKSLTIPARSKGARLFTSLAVAGVAATIMLTAKAAPEAKEKIQNEGGDSEFKDQAELTWKIYAPAGVAALLTVACILKASKLSNLRSEALLMAFMFEPYVTAPSASATS